MSEQSLTEKKVSIMHPRSHAAQSPDSIAYVEADGSVTISFGELEARANRGAHVLRWMGLKRGDTIALLCSNRPEFLDIYWATQRSGLTLVLLSTRLKADEILYILEDSGAALLLASDDLAKTTVEVTDRLHRFPVPVSLVSIGPIAGHPDWNELCRVQPDMPVTDESIGMRMVYSSGTTGRPKGIRGALPEGPPVQSNSGVLRLADYYGLSSETVYLCPAPLYHAAPLAYVTTVQSLGGVVVMMPKFDAESLLQAIERWQVTCVQMVPTMFVRLLKLPDEVRRRYDLSSLKSVIHAAAPCPVPVKYAMIEWLGPIIHEFYSGSEGNGYVRIDSEEWLRKPGSVGRQAFGSIHICDDEGRELPPGEIGTVYFSGGPNFTYHNDPAKTAAAHNPLHPEWTTMGDIGRVDQDGYLFLADRKDFMIISGGVNIYPQEVEDLLLTHPGIADAAVFGVPNPDFGEEVKAVIQPVDWGRAGDDFAEELISWCRERLADVKCPRSVDFAQALPRGDNGKLYKRELKARYWEDAW